MKNVFDVLMERGFIEQTTHEKEIKELLADESVTFYIGFGLLPVVALSTLRQASLRAGTLPWPGT